MTSLESTNMNFFNFSIVLIIANYIKHFRYVSLGLFMLSVLPQMFDNPIYILSYQTILEAVILYWKSLDMCKIVSRKYLLINKTKELKYFFYTKYV